MHYVDLMDAMHFELAAEYLLMAAVLAEIKSRMLLPRSTEIEDDEEDEEELSAGEKEKDREDEKRMKVFKERKWENCEK